jgi:hypothetical protein
LINRKGGKRRASLVRLDAEFQEVIGTVARAGARAAQIAEWPSAVDHQRVEVPVTEPGTISGVWRVKP